MSKSAQVSKLRWVAHALTSPQSRRSRAQQKRMGAYLSEAIFCIRPRPCLIRKAEALTYPGFVTAMVASTPHSLISNMNRQLISSVSAISRRAIRAKGSYPLTISQRRSMSFYNVDVAGLTEDQAEVCNHKQ